MKDAKDNFSEQSAGYAKFRPVYPSELYTEVLKHVKVRNACWDCATGNGQIASELSPHFEQVFATDISTQQLEKAPKIRNVEYLQCRSEDTPFKDETVDLTIVGQAVHWFDHQHFNKEVLRVSKPDSVIALVGYGLMYSDGAFNSALKPFYEDVLGDYWDPERKHIDSAYSSIPFPFDALGIEKDFSIDVEWSLDQMEGYLNTWSSVRKYIRQNNSNPVTPFIDSLQQNGVWKPEEVKTVRFPLFVKLGRVKA